jgi:hypothetical protein
MMFLAKPIVIPDEISFMLERDPIVEWRYDRLRRSGYSADSAFLLAGKREVDTQFAEDLLSKGCEQSTAILILT